MFSRSILCVIVAVVIGVESSAEEPLFLRVSARQGFLDSTLQQRQLDYMTEYGLGDEVAEYAIASLNDLYDQGAVRFRDRLGFEKWVIAEYMARDGHIHQVHCVATDNSDCMREIVREYTNRIGDEAMVSLSDGVTSVTGPSKKFVDENGIEEIRSWVPLHLYYQDGILYHSESDAYVRNALSREKVARIKRLSSSDWFFEARPSLIPKSYRERHLEETFRNLATRRQRHDGEPKDKYARRIAPLQLWESILRAYMFDTESILVTRSENDGLGPVRFTAELTAEKGSRFASMLKEISNRRLMAINQNGLAAGACAVQIPADISESVAQLVSSNLGNSVVSSAILNTIASRKIAFDWLASIPGLQQFTAVIHTNCPVSADLKAVLPLHRFQSRQLLTPIPVAIRADDDHHLELNIGGEIKVPKKTNKADPWVLPPKTILAAYLNIGEFSKAVPDSKANSVFEQLQLSVLRGMVTYYFPHRPVSSDLQISETLVKLREKIQGGTPDDWRIEVQVSVQPQDRKIFGSVTIGPKLYGFWSVAQIYFRSEAQAAAGY